MSVARTFIFVVLGFVFLAIGVRAMTFVVDQEDVIDGDTIRVQQEGSEMLVRLIGIDAPELDKPLWIHAKLYLQDLLDGQSVELYADPMKSDVDIHGRWLRYVMVGGQNVNAMLLSHGYAKEYAYDTEYTLQSRFLAIQSYAQRSQIGIWLFNPQGFKSNCYPSNGELIKDGEYRVYYKDLWVDSINECAKQRRYCNDGILYGSFIHNSCSVRR